MAVSTEHIEVTWRYCVTHETQLYS